MTTKFGATETHNETSENLEKYLFGNDEKAILYHKTEPSPSASVISTSIEKNSSKEVQCIIKENEEVLKISSAEDKNDIDESEGMHWTSLKKQTFEVDNHEQRCLIEDKEKNGLNIDRNVITPECAKQESFLGNLNGVNYNASQGIVGNNCMPHNSALQFDKFETSSFTSTEKFQMEQKPYTLNPTEDAQNIAKENEFDAYHLTNLTDETFEAEKHEQQHIIEDKEKSELNIDGKVITSECSKQESFLENLNGVNSNASHGIVESNIKPRNSALLFDTFETRSFTSTEKFQMEQKSHKSNSTGYAQNIPKENESTPQLFQVVNEHDTGESDAYHLTNLTNEALEAEKHEQQYINEDKEKNGLNIDGKVLTPECSKQESFIGNLNGVNSSASHGIVESNSMPRNSALPFDKFETSSFTSTEKIQMEQKLHKLSPIEDAQNIAKENESEQQFLQVVTEHGTNESDAYHLTNLTDKEFEAEKHEQRYISENKEKNGLNIEGKVLTPEFFKQEIFLRGLNGVNSLENPATPKKSSMPNNNAVSNNNQSEEAAFLLLDSDGQLMYESDEIKTLEDALRYFGLYSLLEDLDKSLEDVRRHKIAEKVHDEYFKQRDKEILNLSLKCHPDKYIRGTESRLKTAHKQQTMVNAVRTVLRYLNAAFLTDIGTDHKFQFYSKLNIISLCNEKEVKCRIYEMRFKLRMISRIKQQNVILQIHKFLIKSKECVTSYLHGTKDEFKKLCDSVFFQLNQCIDGFKRLCEELECMEKKCEFSKEEQMLSFVQNMAKDIKRDLRVLGFLEKMATSSIHRHYRFLSTGEFIDPYFVRPLVWYMNVIVMCRVMSKRNSVWENFTFSIYNHPIIYRPFFNEFSDLEPLFYLAAYYSGGMEYEKEVQRIMNDEFFSMLDESWWKRGIAESKAQIKYKFCEILYYINKDAEIKFNVDHYSEVMTDDFLALEIEKCMSMMNEFEDEKQELSVSIQEIWKKTGKMEGNYDNILQTSEDVNSKIEEITVTNSEIEAQIQANRNKIDELLEKSKKLLANSKTDFSCPF